MTPQEGKKDGSMPFWLGMLWVIALLWIAGYVILGMLGSSPFTPSG
jgi:hypothetical protein